MCLSVLNRGTKQQDFEEMANEEFDNLGDKIEWMRWQGHVERMG